MAPRCWVFSSPFLAEGAAGVAGGEGVVVLLWCFVLLGWWGPLVDVGDAPGDVDAVGVMVCGVAVSTPGLGAWWVALVAFVHQPCWRPWCCRRWGRPRCYSVPGSWWW